MKQCKITVFVEQLSIRIKRVERKEFTYHNHHILMFVTGVFPNDTRNVHQQSC